MAVAKQNLEFEVLKKTGEIHLESKSELALIEIQKNLVKYMSLHGLSQKKLSDLTGISATTISGYFLGKSLMNKTNYRKIAQCLKIAPEQLSKHFLDIKKNVMTPIKPVLLVKQIKSSKNKKLVAINSVLETSTVLKLFKILNEDKYFNNLDTGDNDENKAD